MRTFVLGVGAQKAGTTWLHRYLAEFPEFARGAMKEYHVWDAICRTDEDREPQFEGEGSANREALRTSFVAKPELYFEHFETLLGHGAGVAADITPAYAALPQSAMERIRGGFEARGIAVKVVFLMRDPVERCWSAARMYRRKGLSVADLDPALSEAEFLLAYSKTEHAKRRGRYERTVATIDATFDEENSFIGLYERLFDPDALASLAAFLGVAARTEFAKREHNVGPKEGDLPKEVRAEIARTFTQTLEFCAARFPATLDQWSSYSLL